MTDPSSGYAALILLALIVLVVVGALRRRARRSRMSPEQLASDDIREELQALRRDVRRLRR